MEKFWELLQSSVIVQGCIALGLFGTISYLTVTTGDAPKELWVSFSIILGYYFGSKAQQKINSK